MAKNGREQQTLALLHGRRQTIKPLVKQALDAAVEQTPEIEPVLAELLDIREMGRKTAAEVIFELYLLIDAHGAWDQLTDGSTLDGPMGPCRRGGGGLLR